MKTLKAFIKPFEAPQRSVKIKIWVNFFFLPGIRTLKSLAYFLLIGLGKLSCDNFSEIGNEI